MKRFIDSIHSASYLLENEGTNKNVEGKLSRVKNSIKGVCDQTCLNSWKQTLGERFQLSRMKTSNCDTSTTVAKSTMSASSSSVSSLTSTSPPPFCKLSFELLNVSRCTDILYSRKYDAACLPRPAQLLPILLTGLGGAGTHNLTNQLTKMGIRVDHESLLEDGTVVRIFETRSFFLVIIYIWSR